MDIETVTYLKHLRFVCHQKQLQKLYDILMYTTELTSVTSVISNNGRVQNCQRICSLNRRLTMMRLFNPLFHVGG